MKKIYFSMMARAIASFTFTACEDVPEPYNNPYDQIKPSEPEAVIEPTGSGTAADPFNVAAIIEKTAGLNDGDFYNNSENVYVTGLVIETTEVSAQYGNATYYISDDAKGSNRFYVYRGKLLDGASVQNDTDLQVGDSVTVCGKVKNYKGTLEFDQGNFLTFYKKGEGGNNVTPEAPGTLEKPLTVAEALAYIDNLGADKQSPVGYVKGKICAIGEVDTGQYGNATYSISDDGKDENALQIYRGYSLGGEKFKSANEIKVNDEVIITGKLVNYKGNTKQFAQGSSIYSLNGTTAGGGGGETPAAEVKTVTIAEFNAAAESTTVWYQLTGTVKNLKAGDLYGNFDLEDATGSVYVYGLLAEKGGEKKKFQDLVAAKGITDGCTLTLIGNRGSYNDKIEVMNAYFVSVQGGSGGGTEPTPSGNGGVLEGNKLTVVYGDLGITSIDSPITLVDGTTLTFSQEGGKNKPIYHESTKIVRMYALNSLTINAGTKVIDSVVLNYDTYSGTAYCGNEELYGEAGGKKVSFSKDDATLTFSGVGASAFKVVNDLSTGNSGGVQLRCTGIVINFK